jgi:DNA replication and repair protein RecF
LATAGAEIVTRRQALLQQMATFAAQIHADITKNHEKLTFQYVSQVPEAARGDVDQAKAAILDLLAKHRERELTLRHDLGGSAPR